MNVVSLPLVVPGRVNGLDLCSIQNRIPLDAVKIKEAGFQYVYIKASQYSSVRDLHYPGLVDKCREAGLSVGAYHFCSHDTDPEKQAEFFYKASAGLGSKSGELPPMVDWEFCTPSKYSAHPTHCVQWLERFLRTATGLWYPENAHRKLPRFPVVYTYPTYAACHQPALGASLELGQCPLAFASYKPGKWLPGANQTAVHQVPKPWASNTLWQYSGDGGLPVPGIVGDCDRQLFNGSSGDWDDFRGIARPVSEYVKDVIE